MDASSRPSASPIQRLTRTQDSKQVPVLLNADLQETGDVACDTGSPVGVLRQRFGEHAFLARALDEVPL